MAIQEYKKTLRREMLKNLRTIESPETEGRLLSEQLFQRPELREATTLMAFYPWREEIDLRPLMERWLSVGKSLVLPRVNNDGVSINLYNMPNLSAVIAGYAGIMEPDPDQCDLVAPDSVEVLLVPGLAFDQHGARLGRGAGHYDRLFALIPDFTKRIAVGHRMQLVETALPVEPHDEVVHHVATPDGWVNCR